MKAAKLVEGAAAVPRSTVRPLAASAAPLRRGFTLVEVLVAMMIMAILATVTWQGLDGILRSREASKVALDRTQRLGTVLTQWEQDLLALHQTQAVRALHFDGRTLRLTRRTEGGVALVAWSLREGRWQRWVGPTFTRLADLSDSWIASQGLLGNEPGHLTMAEGATEWQVYCHRGGAWTNCQSTGDAAAPASAGAPAMEALPAAVRLVITLEGGTLTRDIALGPSDG